MPEKTTRKQEVLYTVGHSTKPIKEFVELLNAHDIQQIVDVRTIPKSRHNPQFNEETLQHSLNKANIEYVHLSELGGLRRTTKDSNNLGWHNTSFRGFADYMGTPGFEHGIKELKKIATKNRTAIMCAEAVPWRCHRSLIGDAMAKKTKLNINPWEVFDIMSPRTATKHRMTPFLKVKQGKIIYPTP